MTPRPFRRRRVLHHPDALNCDECSTRDHLIEDGQQSLHVCFIVDNLDDYWQIRRKFHQARRVNHAARAETGDTVSDRGPRESLSPEPLEQRSGERGVMKLIGLSQKDPD